MQTLLAAHVPGISTVCSEVGHKLSKSIGLTRTPQGFGCSPGIPRKTRTRTASGAVVDSAACGIAAAIVDIKVNVSADAHQIPMGRTNAVTADDFNRDSQRIPHCLKFGET